MGEADFLSIGELESEFKLILSLLLKAFSFLPKAKSSKIIAASSSSESLDTADET